MTPVDALLSLFFGISSGGVLDFAKYSWRKVTKRSLQDLFVDSFNEAARDLQTHFKGSGDYQELKFDSDAFNRLLQRNSFSSKVAGSVNESELYSRIAELLRDEAVVQSDSLSDDGYKQLISNLTNHAKERLPKSLLENPEVFRGVLQAEVQHGNRRVEDLYEFLSTLNLEERKDDIKAIKELIEPY